MSYKENNLKNVLHGFFLAVATSIGEASTILPLIVKYFGGSYILVGIFVTLLRGGAIFVQLIAAFYAQSYSYVMPYLRRVFFFRFLGWFFIGISIYIFGKTNPNLTLFLIGVGLFIFSFSAGFGGVYFKEIIAKIFNKEERGKSMANRQLFASIGALISGGVAGVILEKVPKPDSFAYLFLISSFLMAIGLIAFATIKEPIKKQVRKREESFREFLKNVILFLKRDKKLKYLIISVLLGYGYLLSLPFIILEAKEKIGISGWMVGAFITIEMVGSIIGNLFLWKRFIKNYTLMMKIAISIFIVMIGAILLFKNSFIYLLAFFLFGMGRDGFKNSEMNLAIEISPQDLRPIYVAIESTLTSIGLFFPILGGIILEHFDYKTLYIITAFILACSIFYLDRFNKINR